jgi:hypothetical protein
MADFDSPILGASGYIEVMCWLGMSLWVGGGTLLHQKNSLATRELSS